MYYVPPARYVLLSKWFYSNWINCSSEISEESELQLTTKMNEVIKQRWVALGPRNYGKSIEWKLEGEPWDTEGLYADHTRGVYLLCLLLEAIQPLGWRLVSSAGKDLPYIKCTTQHKLLMQLSTSYSI